LDYNATYSLLIRYIDGETNAEESALIEELLRSNESWKKEFELLKSLDQKIISTCKLNTDTNQYWEQLKGKLSASLPVKSKPLWLTFSKYAAAAVIILLAGLYFLKPFSTPNLEQGLSYSTGKNETKTILLSDGSQVILGKNTTLTIDKNFNKDQRKTKLNGLAYFVVKTDSKRPFIALTQNTATKVIGTSFEISTLENNTVNVQLYQGKIEFSDADKSILLQPGQQVIYKVSAKKIITKPLDISSRDAWTVSGLNFKDTPLFEIIQKLEQTYAITLQIPVSMKNERYTISFDGLDLSASLQLLEELTDSKITKKDSIYILKP